MSNKKTPRGIGVYEMRVHQCKILGGRYRNCTYDGRVAVSSLTTWLITHYAGVAPATYYIFYEAGFSPHEWCRRKESNPQPTDYRSVALPVVLPRQNNKNGIEGRTRTYNNTDYKSAALPIVQTSIYKRQGVTPLR